MNFMLIYFCSLNQSRNMQSFPVSHMPSNSRSRHIYYFLLGYNPHNYRLFNRIKKEKKRRINKNDVGTRRSGLKKIKKYILYIIYIYIGKITAFFCLQNS